MPKPKGLITPVGQDHELGGGAEWVRSNHIGPRPCESAASAFFLALEQARNRALPFVPWVLRQLPGVGDGPTSHFLPLSHTVSCSSFGPHPSTLFVDGAAQVWGT